MWGRKAGTQTHYSAALIEAAQLFAAESKITNPQQATTLFESMVAAGLTVKLPEEPEPVTLVAKDMMSSIQEVSIGLHLAHPEHFIPYGFVTLDYSLFDFLRRIGELFDLALPSVPGKRDLAGRERYYAQLNEAFYEFRRTHELSAVEMCAFLHDFAPRLLEKMGELPETLTGFGPLLQEHILKVTMCGSSRLLRRVKVLSMVIPTCDVEMFCSYTAYHVTKS